MIMCKLIKFCVNFSLLVGFHVTAKVDLPLERCGAGLAGEWLESGMPTAVGDKIRRLTEGLATMTTNVRLLALDSNNQQQLL